MRRKRKLGVGQRRLLAEFSANMAVAWFAGGVISVILGNIKITQQTFLVIISGLVFGFAFLLYGLYLSRRIRI